MLKSLSADNEIHCKYCSTPINVWESLKTYNGRSCELYSDVLDLVFDDDVISFNRLLSKARHLEKKYPDIPDFNATIKEIFDILVDTGVIN